MSEVEPVRPEDVLPDERDTTTIEGVSVRKGSVGAFVANVKLLESLDPADLADLAYQAVVEQVRALAVPVRAVGVFDVLAPRSPLLAELLGEPPL
jgi:hypothetical protein